MDSASAIRTLEREINAATEDLRGALSTQHHAKHHYESACQTVEELKEKIAACARAIEALRDGKGSQLDATLAALAEVVQP